MSSFMSMVPGGEGSAIQEAMSRRGMQGNPSSLAPSQLPATPPSNPMASPVPTTASATPSQGMLQAQPATVPTGTNSGLPPQSNEALSILDALTKRLTHLSSIEKQQNAPPETSL